MPQLFIFGWTVPCPSHALPEKSGSLLGRGSSDSWTLNRWNKTEKLLSSSFCFPCWFLVSAFTKLENSALHLYFCQVLNASPGFSLTNLVQPVSISVSHEIKFSVWERHLNLGHITSHFTPEHKTCFLLLDPASFVYGTFCSKSTRQLFVCFGFVWWLLGVFLWWKYVRLRNWNNLATWHCKWNRLCESLTHGLSSTQEPHEPSIRKYTNQKDYSGKKC